MKKFPMLSLLALIMASVAQAATLGSDNTSSSAYSDGWQNGDNGGAGFGPWTLNTTGTTNGTGTGGSTFSGQYLGTSTVLTGTTPNINSPTNSFGIYAKIASQSSNNNAAAFSSAYRNFDTGSLGIGQTFTIQIAVNFRNGQKGFELQSGNAAGLAGSAIFTFKAFDSGAGDGYYIRNDTTYFPQDTPFSVSGNPAAGGYSNNTVFTLSFTQISASVGNFSIARSGGLSGTMTGQYAGLAGGFKLFAQSTQSSDENNFFFNSLAVIPEPSAVGAAISAGLALIVLLRRRKTGLV